MSSLTHQRNKTRRYPILQKRTQTVLCFLKTVPKDCKILKQARLISPGLGLCHMAQLKKHTEKAHWFFLYWPEGPYKGYHSFQQGDSTTKNLYFFDEDGRSCKLPLGTKSNPQVTAVTESCQLREKHLDTHPPTTSEKNAQESAEPSVLTSLSTKYRKQASANKRRQQKPNIQHRKTAQWAATDITHKALDIQGKCSTTKPHP